MDAIQHEPVCAGKLLSGCFDGFHRTCNAGFFLILILGTAHFKTVTTIPSSHDMNSYVDLVYG